MSDDPNLQKTLEDYDSRGSGAIKVLMIEDDEFIGDMVTKKLADKGCVPYSARNGEEGLRLVKEFKPHVIILDLMLPRMSGEEVLKQLKSADESKSIPVIVFSNKSEQTDVAGNLETGAAAYLIKSSTDLNRLVDVVKEHGMKTARGET